MGHGTVMMKVAVRVDASVDIGTGHVMRCLSLAQELHRRSCSVQFICRNHPGHMEGVISQWGFPVSLLPEPDSSQQNRTRQEESAAWLGASQEEDALQTLQALGTKDLDWLIVDHYGLDSRWEALLYQAAHKIMVIDDLADRGHECDLLLDQNYFQNAEKRYEGLVPATSTTLLGPRYALLRPEFHQARTFCHMRGNNVARVLVYFGGSDEKQLTGTALQALNCPELTHLLVDVVAGVNNQHIPSLRRQAEKRFGTRLHIQPAGFTELLVRADLCIGAGGSTTWERLCLGLPSIVVSLAQNQEKCLDDLHHDGYLTWIGTQDDVTCERICNAVLREKSRLQERDFVRLGSDLVDGLGAARTVEILLDQ